MFELKENQKEMRKIMLAEENKQINNQIDEWLLSKAGNENQRKPILQLVEKVLENYKKEKGNLNPPIDLNVLGECLDIKVKKIVLTKNINCDALLIPIEGGFKIKLKNENKLHYTFRTRYSCAHEMAHTFFYKMEDRGVPFKAVPSGSKYEEDLCDIAAAELLMPKEIFEMETKKLVKGTGYSLSVLIKLKEKFKISLHSVCIRAVNARNGGWEDYLISKWDPIFDNNKTAKIIGFEKDWAVSKNMNVTLPNKVYETGAIFEIFKEMMNRPGEEISKYSYENDLYPGGIPTKVILFNDGYIKTSFLLMVSINEYLKKLQYSDFDDDYSKGNIIFDFNFEEKTLGRQKKTMKKGKKGLVDFM
jgi:hypothetical protein